MISSGGANRRFALRCDLGDYATFKFPPPLRRDQAVKQRLLSSTQAERFYDRFGRKLDSQAFYETPALNDLAAHLEFDTCRAVAEFGCGTGRFAEELFESHLSHQATYVGWDISEVMVRLTRERLARYGTRAAVRKLDGGYRLNSPNCTFDRFVCTYVLDLLPDDEAQGVLEEARRVLMPGDLVGLISLTNGKTLIPWLITTIWDGLRAVSPLLVGGCRPIELLRLISPSEWKIEYRNVVTSFGVPSEIVVARKPQAN